MLTEKQLDELKRELVDRCMKKETAPYQLGPNVEFKTLGGKIREWEDIRPGSLLFVNEKNCIQITDSRLIGLGYGLTNDDRTVLVKDVAIVDNDIIIETLFGDTLTTLDLKQEWRQAISARDSQRLEGVICAAIEEKDKSTHSNTIAFCKELGITIPHAQRTELLAKISETIGVTYTELNNKYDDMKMQCNFSNTFIQKDFRDAIKNTIKEHEELLKKQEIEIFRKNLIATGKPVIYIDNMYINNESLNRKAFDKIQFGSKVEISGSGIDCRKQGNQFYVNQDVIVVGHYQHNNAEIVETANCVFTNSPAIKEAVIEAERAKIEEKNKKNWEAAKSHLDPEALTFFKDHCGHFPAYPYKETNRLLDSFYEGMPDSIVQEDAHASRIAVQNYEDQLKSFLTNAINTCLDNGIPIISWNNPDIEFGNYVPDLPSDTFKQYEVYYDCIIPRSNECATLPRHCLVLGEDGTWAPIAEEMRDICVGDVRNDKHMFAMLTDKGFVTNFDISQILERALEQRLEQTQEQEPQQTQDDSHDRT